MIYVNDNKCLCVPSVFSAASILIPSSTFDRCSSLISEYYFSFIFCRFSSFSALELGVTATKKCNETYWIMRRLELCLFARDRTSGPQFQRDQQQRRDTKWIAPWVIQWSDYYSLGTRHSRGLENRVVLTISRRDLCGYSFIHWESVSR